jgi:Bifunctional DNA primase/polymerase, N-terminal
VSAPDLLRAALYLADRGLPVFPCRPADKAPLTPNGFKDASLDPSIIRQRWTCWPDALIGAPTGAASGIDVVDLDMKNGHNGIAAFETICAGRPLPPHPVVQTVSGGRHLLFRTTPGRTARCSASRIAPGIDVRGAGGYVIVPPSPGYVLLQRADLHPAPDWLLDLLDPPRSQRAPGQKPAWLRIKHDQSFYAAAVERALRAVEGAREGSRHTTLLRSANHLAHLAAEKRIGEAEARAALRHAASACGLPDEETDEAIEDAFGYVESCHAA